MSGTYNPVNGHHIVQEPKLSYTDVRTYKNNISFLFILIQPFSYFDSFWGSLLLKKSYFLILEVLSIPCHYKVYIRLQIYGVPSNKLLLGIYSFLLSHCTIYANGKEPLTTTKVNKLLLHTTYCCMYTFVKHKTYSN
jgi:hypothetical protein